MLGSYRNNVFNTALAIQTRYLLLEVSCGVIKGAGSAGNPKTCGRVAGRKQGRGVAGLQGGLLLLHRRV